MNCIMYLNINIPFPFTADGNLPPVTDVCLGCICEAVSNCNLTLKCDGDSCGLFRITWAYWADGGKPTLNNQSPDASDGNNYIQSSIISIRSIFINYFIFSIFKLCD